MSTMWGIHSCEVLLKRKLDWTRPEVAELSSDTVTTTLVKYMVLLTSYFITDSSHQGYILKDVTIIKAIQVLILLKPSIIQKYIWSSFQSFVSFFFFITNGDSGPYNHELQTVVTYIYSSLKFHLSFCLGRTINIHISFSYSIYS